MMNRIACLLLGVLSYPSLLAFASLSVCPVGVELYEAELEVNIEAANQLKPEN